LVWQHQLAGHQPPFRATHHVLLPIDVCAHPRTCAHRLMPCPLCCQAATCPSRAPQAPARHVCALPVLLAHAWSGLLGAAAHHIPLEAAHDTHAHHASHHTSHHASHHTTTHPPPDAGLPAAAADAHGALGVEQALEGAPPAGTAHTQRAAAPAPARPAQLAPAPRARHCCAAQV
jgi:hypothetical protein